MRRLCLEGAWGWKDPGGDGRRYSGEGRNSASESGPSFTPGRAEYYGLRRSAVWMENRR